MCILAISKYSGAYRKIESLMKSYKSTLFLVRPTMIYGSIFDKNISKLLLFIKRYHVILILGNDPLFRPVHYKDLAMFIYLLFERGIYNSSGTAIISDLRPSL